MSDDGVYKITLRCELLDTGRSLRLHRLEAHPCLKFVILSDPAAIHEETDGAQRVHQEAQIICSSAFPPIRPSHQPDDSSPLRHSPTPVCEIVR
jgi:hypothetical protein